MSVLREVVEIRGTSNHLDAGMRFLVYPNSDAQVPNNIPPGLADIGDQAMNHGAANSYAVVQDYRYPNLTASSKSELLTKWENENKPDERGSHILLTGNFSFTAGIAEPVVDTGAWTNKLHAVSQNTGNNPKITAMHEALHTLINPHIDGVAGLHKDDSGEHRDHDLGQIFATDQTSPLAMGYETTHAQHGSCSGGVLPLGVTTRLSECTKTGLEETADEAGIV